MNVWLQAILGSRLQDATRRELLRSRLAHFGGKGAIHAFLGLSLSSFVAVAVFIFTSVNRELTEVALERRGSVASLAAATLSEKLARITDIGVSLAAPARFRQLVLDGQWWEAVETLRDVPREFPGVERAFLVNGAGTLMADTPQLADAAGKDLASRDWYREVARTGKAHVSQVHARIAAPQLNVFAVAVPIAKPTGGLAGVLVLQIHVGSAFFEWAREVDPGRGGVTYIVDPSGRVAFDSGSRLVGESAKSPGALLERRPVQGKEGVRIAVDPANNEETIFAYASAEPFGWGVVMQQPARASLAILARNHQLRRLSVAYVLLLLLGASMAYLAYRLTLQRRSARERILVHAELERRVVERTSQLEAANRELEAFSYSVSHDLRGPLRSMDGFSMLLIEDYGDKLEADGKDALERIRAASQRMGSLIDDLLRLSHVTRAELNLRQVDLTALAREIADLLSREAPGRAVQWSIEADLSVQADPALMRIALQNLLENAWKFTGKTERAAIRVGALRRDARTIYFVADNGAGFDMTHASKLFGAFQRMHHAGEFPGTGIGLAIVRRIMSRHDGEVWAEAREGEGATFFFDIQEIEGGPR